MFIPSYVCIFNFVVVCLFFSLSNCVRVPLTGDDWFITDNRSYSVRGRIPATIHTILLSANQITEPYLGYNYLNLRSLIYSSWTFRKNFSLTQDFLTFDLFALHFDQIDTIANVTLNQCFLGQTNNMFIGYTFNIERICLQVDNQLQIDFESPVLYATNQARLYNDSRVPPDCPADIQHGECHVQFIRKEPCSFSWDWSPAFGPIGIPGDLYLEAMNSMDISIQLESVNVASYLSSTKRWQVDVLLISRNDRFQSQLNFLLENTSFMYQTNCTFDHQQSISLSIPDDDIQLWWPNGYGNQTLYTLSVYNQEQFVGSRLIGFRTVQLIEHDYEPNINGTSFYFMINYQPIFIKGSNWVPPDSFQERVSDERLERLLLSAKLANMNMLRVWGGGIYERDAFYDLADRLGIMLWHDFMFACSLYPVDELFLTNVRNEVIYQVKRLQSHASIVLWSGNNENEASIAQNWWNISVDAMPKAKEDYRKLYVETVQKALREIDKGNNRPFVISSPSNGLESIKEDYIAKDPNDSLFGDVHFYGYLNDSWNSTTYPVTRFLSETGVQALPSLETWYEVTRNQSDLSIESDFIQNRDFGVGQIPIMISHIKSNLPTPVTNDPLKNFTQWIYLSQINQAMTLKSISDVCRVHSTVEMIDPKTSQGNTMGLMYWQFNDIWQTTTGSTVEYGLRWKMGHYYVKHMYEPVYPVLTLTPYLANLTDASARISLYVINDLPTEIHAKMICSIHTVDSFSASKSIVFNIFFDFATMQHIVDLPYAEYIKNGRCSNDKPCLFHCLLNYNEKQISQTLFLSQPKNYQLFEPNLHVENLTQVSSTEITFTVFATRPALFIWLNVLKNISGYFSENGFHMFEPTKSITFHSWTPISDFDLQLISLFDITHM